MHLIIEAKRLTRVADHKRTSFSKGKSNGEILTENVETGAPGDSPFTGRRD